MHLSSLLLACTAGLSGAAAKTTQPILFAGSYTRQEAWVNGTGKGIYTFKFNASDGSLTPFGVTQVGTNPMYVQGSTKTFSDGKPILYAINSVGNNSTNQPGTQTGFVSALTLQSDGTLKTLNTLETQGAVPVHISLSPNENFVVVSNYANSVTMYPLKDDGSLSSKTFHQAFPIGSNVVASRQASGHPHSTMWLPHSNHVVVADLGSDELHQYELDQENQTLKSIGSVHSLPGSGPRHMAHHPNGRFAYVVGELTNSVSVYKIAQSSKLLEDTAVQNIRTVPVGYVDTFSAESVAEIRLLANGKFLYTTNRGNDSIAIFKVNETDGTLTSLGWESSRGIMPWGLAIYENWLIVSNTVSNSLQVFAVDSETGLLSHTGNSYVLESAATLYMAELQLDEVLYC